jgi:negative regulator of sigma E activity
VVIAMNKQMTDLEHKAREAFDASVENLDAETRSRLNQARQAALAAGEALKVPAWRSLAPVGAVAAAVVAAVLWRVPGDGTGNGGSPHVQANGEAPIDLVEVVAEGEDLELMTEDLEFYSWAADQAATSNGVG